ncbi:MAG: hypothetical protein R3236_11965, partial [Phycisphaeraceae bacterium]|nr:hypothetical protein [Phycisphaeraceae bacterium]
MRPTLLFQWMLGLWAATAVAACFWTPAIGPWLSAGVALGCVALIDAWRLRGTAVPEVHRELPNRFALDVEGSVQLTVRNNADRPLRLSVFDGIPPTAEAGSLPIDLHLPVGRLARLNYPVRLRERGSA